MVGRVLNIVYKEVRGLHQAAYVLATFTLGSQILALVRDRLLAHQFGAGIELDLYYTAFRIPDFLYVLFASTLSVYVLIPFISKRKAEGDSAPANHLLSQIFSLFLMVYVLIAILAMVYAPTVVYYFFPGFVEHTDTLVLLIRILLFQPLLLGISSLFGVITQLENRFVLYAISPLIYNLGIIFGLVLLYPFFGISGLAWGVVIGALGHVFIQLPSILKSTLRPRFTLDIRRADIFAVCKTSLTRAVTLSLHQFVLLGLVGFASIMAVGSVSVFQFAYNLQSVPLAIIGVSYSVAAFPLLAKLYAEKKYVELGSNITTALRHILFWSLPAIALFIVLRAQFVRVVLGSGAFDWNDTRLTAAILALFMLSLASQAVHLLLVRALYAVGNTRLPFYVTLFSATGALLISFYFYTILLNHGTAYAFLGSVMRLNGVEGIEVLALPLGYSCALILHSVALLILSKRRIHIHLHAIVKPSMHSLIASLAGGYVAYVTLNYFVTDFEPHTLIAIFMQGLVAGLAGLAGIVLVHFLVQSEEIGEITRTLRKRLVREASVVPPQNEDQLAL